ncbi:MAG: aspartate-alanine antiporter [Chromatiales bacterium]|nr:aspartate-alanine antiporter [Chromatiales bacterium]
MRLANWLIEALRTHGELALFLALALGYALGKLRLGSFKVGPVLGCLVAGVLVGQLDVPVSRDLKYAFFLLFLFAIGYKTGPQFFSGLKSSGLPQTGLTLFLCGTGLGTAWLVATLFNFDVGTAAGLVAGGLTESATVGTAGDALARLALDPAVRGQLVSNVAVAFAVTYLVGLITAVWVLSVLGPKLMRVDLAAECRQLEEQMGAVTAEPGVLSAYAQHGVRAYRVTTDLAGRTARQLEELFGGERVFVERVRQAGGLKESTPGLVLQPGDTVALAGRRTLLLGAINPLAAHEVDDAELLDIPVVIVDMTLSNRALAGRPLKDVAHILGEKSRGVFLRQATRSGQVLPLTMETVLERGDVLTVVGARNHVEAIAPEIGYAEWATSATDMVTVGLAVVAGGLIGLPAIRIAALEIGLSLAVGVLIGGLVAGWLRSLSRRFGRIPEPALWLFDSVGLNAFLALVGISAGPDFVRGLQESGLPLVLAGVLVCGIPHIATILLGRYVLKMHPGILLGVCAGAGTSAPGLAAVQDVAKSKIPTLGYGVSYAVGNVLLALWGTVIVLLMAA